MPSLARALLETYTDSDSVTFLTNLFTIQAVAGRYADSRKTLATLDRRYRSSVPEIRATHVLYAMYAMYAQAMARGEQNSSAVLSREFARGLRQLDHQTSALLLRGVGDQPPGSRRPHARGVTRAARRHDDRARRRVRRQRNFLTPS
jgi:hypothetical protein